MVKLLLDRGADVNRADNGGMTSLMYAANKGYEEITRLLLVKGADPNMADDDGYTALMDAAENGHKGVVELLVLHGADVNMADNFGITALMWGADLAHDEVVQVLLESGADPDAKDKSGKTTLYTARKKKLNKVVKIIETFTAGTRVSRMSQLLRESAERGRVQKVKELLEKGNIDVNNSNEEGTTPLMLAAMNGHEEMVEVLLENGADPDAVDNDGNTALMVATEFGHKTVANALEHMYLSTGMLENMAPCDEYERIILVGPTGAAYDIARERWEHVVAVKSMQDLLALNLTILAAENTVHIVNLEKKYADDVVKYVGAHGNAVTYFNGALVAEHTVHIVNLDNDYMDDVAELDGTPENSMTFFTMEPSSESVPQWEDETQEISRMPQDPSDFARDTQDEILTWSPPAKRRRKV